MARLTSKQRKHLPASDFVFPKRRAYPIDTKARARAALQRVSEFSTPSQKSAVRAAVKRKYPSIKEGKN